MANNLPTIADSYSRQDTDEGISVTFFAKNGYDRAFMAALAEAGYEASSQANSVLAHEVWLMRMKHNPIFADSLSTLNSTDFSQVGDYSRQVIVSITQDNFTDTTLRDLLNIRHAVIKMSSDEIKDRYNVTIPNQNVGAGRSMAGEKPENPEG